LAVSLELKQSFVDISEKLTCMYTEEGKRVEGEESEEGRGRKEEKGRG